MWRPSPIVSLRNEHETILSLAELSLVQIGRYLLETVYWVMLKIGLALLVLALLDYAFQWWKQEQDLRMTMQELREEMKNLQGDPQVIAAAAPCSGNLSLQRLKPRCPRPTWSLPTRQNWPLPFSTIPRR